MAAGPAMVVIAWLHGKITSLQRASSTPPCISSVYNPFIAVSIYVPTIDKFRFVVRFGFETGQSSTLGASEEMFLYTHVYIHMFICTYSNHIYIYTLEPPPCPDPPDKNWKMSGTIYAEFRFFWIIVEVLLA